MHTLTSRGYANCRYVFYELKRFEEAGKAYQQAIQYDPSITQAYIDLTKALVDKAHILFERVKLDLFYEEAIFAYQQAILFNSSYPNAYLQLGRALYKTRGHTKTQEMLISKPFNMTPPMLKCTLSS